MTLLLLELLGDYDQTRVRGSPWGLLTHKGGIFPYLFFSPRYSTFNLWPLPGADPGKILTFAKIIKNKDHAHITTPNIFNEHLSPPRDNDVIPLLIGQISLEGKTISRHNFDHRLTLLKIALF